MSHGRAGCKACCPAYLAERSKRWLRCASTEADQQPRWRRRTLMLPSPLADTRMFSFSSLQAQS